MFTKTGITEIGKATDRLQMQSQPLKILAEGVKCEVAIQAHRSTGLKQRTVPYRDPTGQMNCLHNAGTIVASVRIFAVF
ncbi:MAG: hypothetical protein MUE44_01980 [Oscillatoriaceae cyanobacterium Prado104]|jgi:hypothetical protein|nr:hypothetical protein [Oscillatoriaceae cyanobacterium Prado104]